MSTKLITIFGTWIFSDAIYSLILYIPKGESWIKCHSIRVIRLVIGLIMMIYG